MRYYRGQDGNRQPMNTRYVGSLVADFHRNLLGGGLFAYPANRKNKRGKLRLLYEASPLAFIVEQAGGAASDGTERILDIHPTELHQRTPLFIGSANDVDAARALLGGSGRSAASLSAVGSVGA
jgi:fructose-1,6-bisphosphatase I